MLKSYRGIRRAVVLILAATVTIAVLLPDECGAIPAFARKYKMSCTTCHAPAPRLKPYGEDFAANAFRLEGKEPARYFHDTGDELLTLQRELPVAVRVDAFVDYTYQDKRDITDLKTPYGMKLMSGGNISDHIGYYFYFYMSERGEVAGIEDAYLHFNNLFGIELDLLVGQFQVSDPLFKRELRLTFEDYRAYGLKIGSSPTNLTYDRGFMILYGSPFGLDAVVEIVNGNGKGEPIMDNFDEDDWKNVFLRLSQSVGPVRVGGFTYLCNSVRQNAGRTVENEHYYWGVDGTLDIGDRLRVNAQYLERNDDNPFFFNTSPVDIKTTGGLVEVIWAVHGEMGRPFVTFLYNYIDSELEMLDYRTETLSVSYLVRRNLRLLTEATFNEEEESWRLVGGFVSAF
ncbi:MAG TPA: hypothetical protein VMX58_13075 [Patescibacteria group bacterium]|nr:hypothetical protein [Patescibacteria group bacterium]